MSRGPGPWQASGGRRRAGSYLSHRSATDEVPIYRRESDEDTKTVALNLSDEPQDVQLRSGKVLFSTVDPGRNEDFTVSLAPARVL
ncbi:MAG: DUF3459 domain-containing protein [Acidobacteria bacterium]|nr:DUF3459 domain-containing protein [Acidobacteriota bacterium]